MLDQVYTCPVALSQVRAGPLGSLLDGYSARLLARGFARSTVRSLVRSVVHFGSWLRSRAPSLQAVNGESVRSFLCDHLPRCRCPDPAVRGFRLLRSALHHLLRLLRDPAQADATSRGAPRPTDAADAAVGAFVLYLRQTAGLAQDTCRGRAYFVRKFLQGKFGSAPPRWDALRPADVVSFVVGYAQRDRRAAAREAADALRSFLRHLQSQSLCGGALVAAVPRIPQWRLSHLPRVLTAEQLDTFLGTFDRSTPTGRRDYAMALLQADLGLRAGEVAGLRLEDLDWRAATVRVVTGKGGRDRVLPLPARPGQAVADYLRDGRPETACRQVFVRHCSLRGTPVNTAVIQTAMRPAYARVPGCEGWAGTHALRHTAATRLHRSGARLKEVADVLGHRSLDTSAIYTKVDLPDLAAVALPWPQPPQLQPGPEREAQP